MPQTAFPISPAPVVPVKGAHDFPVRRIFCIGRNYAAHAAEMGHAVDREAPFYFIKSAHAVLLSGHDMAYPPRTNDLHHEMELTVAIGAEAKDVTEQDAMKAVFGYGCGLDMTRRDLQAAAKEKRRPWDTGKDFDSSAILGPLTLATDVTDLEKMTIELHVNGALKQHAMIADMVWSIPEIIADLSTLYTLCPGDLIMTGTPSGVGPVVISDQLHGAIGDLAPVTTKIV